MRVAMNRHCCARNRQCWLSGTRFGEGMDLGAAADMPT
jgi:hypothetical protein